MKKFVAACLFPVFLAITADADIIYFKDGMKTICQDKAWEENDQVKCEYAGWILTYQKSDVLRILKSRSSKPTTQPAIKDPKKDQVKIPPGPAGVSQNKLTLKKQKDLLSTIPEDPINIGQTTFPNTRATKKPSRPFL
ncbi:MAG: hypothetical protein KJP23_11915 [Deltaproteobacteria bacterium]|nr:hypothetical protein [Deltaproteobacteria bacterium]